MLLRRGLAAIVLAGASCVLWLSFRPSTTGHLDERVSPLAPFHREGEAVVGSGAGWEVRLEAGVLVLNPRAEQPVRLGPATAAIGARSLSGSPPTLTLAEGGWAVLARSGELVERLESAEEGLEQSWRFEARPAGDGALVVRVPFDTTPTRRDEGGLHFAGSDGIGLRYGHATWVDADGVRTPVPARWEDGVVLEVSEEVLARSKFPAVLDPVISAEFFLSPNRERRSWSSVTGYEQNEASIAWSGSQYGVAWALDDAMGGTMMYFGRVTAAGAMIEPVPLPLGPGAGAAYLSHNATASNGTDFLVVWANGFAIRGVRVSSAGVVLDTTPLTIVTPPSGVVKLPVVAWNGTNYLVAWQDSRSGTNRIYANRVTSAGAVLDGNGFQVSNHPSAAQIDPSIACASSDCLIAWSDNRNSGTTGTDVFGVRISTAGTRVDANDVALNTEAGPAFETALAWNGSTYLLGWHTATPGATLFVARISSTLTVTDATGVTIATGQNSNAAYPIAPRLTAVGANFVMTWLHEVGLPSVYAARISGAAALLNGPTRISANGSGYGGGVASDGTRALAAFGGPGTTAPNINGNHVNGSTGAVEDGNGFELATAAVLEEMPAVSFNGTNALAVWWTNNGIRGTRLSPSGTVLDPSALHINDFPLATAASQGVDVTWTGGKWLVVWADQRANQGQLYMARVTPAGVVELGAGFKVTDGGANQTELRPAVASNGADAVVLYERNDSNAGDIFAVSISTPETSPQVTSRFLVNDPMVSSFQYRPDIAWNANKGVYLAVWFDQIGSANAVVGTVMQPGSIAVNATPVIPLAAFNIGYVAEPAVAATGGNTFLVASNDVNRSVTAREIPITAGNTISVSLPASFSITGLGQAQNPDVAFDGTTALVVWNGLTDPTRLMAQRVVDGGVPLGAPFALQTGTEQRGSAAVTATGPRSWLVTSDEGANVSLYGRSLVRGLTIGNSTPTATAQSGSVAEDTPLPLTLTGTDPDNDPLGYVIVSMPTNGALSGTPPNVTYTPTLNFNGPDSFTFKVNDGVVDSAPATVTLTVTPVNDAPVANAQSGLTTAEDTPLPITFTATDVDSATLTYSVVVSNQGTVTGTGASRTFTPNANFFGPATIDFVASDGLLTSSPATISITVTPVNDAPVANPAMAMGMEDSMVPVNLTGTDVENSPLTYQVVTNPTKGALSGTPPNLMYTPALNTNGIDTFTFTVNDGALTSAPGTATITITAVNDPPVANPQSLATQEDTPLDIVLTGSDVDNATLTFAVIGQPSVGTYSGSGANITYTPPANFSGTATINFTANDGQLTSPQATITITVNPVNDPPTAQAQSVTTNEDTAIAVTLMATDPDSATLTYTVLGSPAHGTLTGTAPSLTYTPAANYNGPDSFTFKANDGTLDSAAATVNITVSPVNDAPTAQTQALGTPVDTALNITLTGTDIEGSSLTFAIVNPPTNGTLTGAGANRVYTPNTAYRGNDSFTFKANDGALDSAPAQVTIAVGSLDSPPVAMSQTLTTPEDTALAVTLGATDPDPMTTLTFTVLTPPQHGALSGTGASLSYTPAPNYSGPDSFTFKANDGTLDSNVATVTLTVTPVNDLPVAFARNVGTFEDTPLVVTLDGMDVEGSPLTFRVVTPPANGMLTGTPPLVTYTPNLNFDRQDSFTYVANDGTADGPPATVTIVITPVNDAPVATPQAVTLVQDMSKAIVLVATDVDSTALTFEVVAMPVHGALSGTPPNVTYQPSTGYRGADSFTFKAKDDAMLDSLPATVDLTITAGNSPPIVQSQTVPVQEDTPTPVSVNGFDPDGTTLTWTITNSPSHGTLAVAPNDMPPNYVYTPAPDFNGADSFIIEASDGQATKSATINLQVAPVNDRPKVEALMLTTEVNVAVGATLRGTDVDGDPVTFRIVDPPSHGELTGAGEERTYTPTKDFTGDDTFTYVANDGAIDSALGTVTITVTPVGGKVAPKDTVHLNGWSCGCQSTNGSGTFALALLGLMTWSLRRRRPAVAPRAVRGVWLGVLLVALVPWAARAADPKKAGSAKTSKKGKKGDKVPEPAPAPPEPTPEPAVTAPAPTPAPVVVEPAAPPAKPGPPTLVVLDVEVTVPNEKLDGAALYDILATAVDQSRLFKVMGTKEIATLLGVERQRQLLGCSESSCFAELAGAVGAQYVLSGTVGKVGNDYVVTTRLLDTRANKLVGRGTLQVGDANLLLNATWRTCQEALDAAANTLPPLEADRWKSRPRDEPAKAVAPATSQFGVALSALGGWQPLQPAGSRVTIGGEVDVSWRIARFDLGAGLIVSPVPGLRIFAGFALLSLGPSRLSVVARGSGFFASNVYGGGLGVTYELSFNKWIAAQAGVAADVYSGGNPVLLALLGGLGVAAHF